jgi:hypothetical protein
MPAALLTAIDKWAKGEGAGGRMNRHARKGTKASSRSDAIRKLVIKALGGAGRHATEAAEEERRHRADDAFLERYDLKDYVHSLRPRAIGPLGEP